MKNIMVMDMMDDDDGKELRMMMMMMMMTIRFWVLLHAVKSFEKAHTDLFCTESFKL